MKNLNSISYALLIVLLIIILYYIFTEPSRRLPGLRHWECSLRQKNAGQCEQTICEAKNGTKPSVLTVFTPLQDIEPIYEIRMTYSAKNDTNDYVLVFRSVCQGFTSWPVLITEHRYPCDIPASVKRRACSSANCKKVPANGCEPIIQKIKGNEVIDTYFGAPVYTYMERWFRDNNHVNDHQPFS